MGSTRVARRAGSQQAASATRPSSSATATNVHGSVAPTPKSTEVNTRVSASAPARPSATPSSTSLMLSPTTRCSTCSHQAPSAMRTPISWVRLATEKETTL
jgi:hypothetical protein